MYQATLNQDRPVIRAMFLVISFYPLVSVFYRPDNGFMIITQVTLSMTMPRLMILIKSW